MTSKPAIKKNFAEKFGKLLEEHINFGSKLAKSISTSNVQSERKSPKPRELREIEQLSPTVNAQGALNSERDSEKSTFTARVRNYIEQHGNTNQESERSSQRGNFQGMTDRALSSGSVRIRYEDDVRDHQNEMRYSVKSVRSMRDSGRKERDMRVSSAQKDPETWRNRSFSANSAREDVMIDEPKDANSVRRAAENSRRMSRTSPMGRLSRSEFSSIDSRDSIKQNPKVLTPGEKDSKHVNGMRRRTLEILNNSQSSQGRSSVKDSERCNGVRRPMTTRTEDESMYSDSSRKSADFALNSAKSSKKKEITSLLFPGLGKKFNFKKQIIADSMTRLKNSEQTTAVVTRNNSVKSGLALEHEFGTKQTLINTSLESGDYAKSSEDSFHLKDSNKTSERLALKAENILEKIQTHEEQEQKIRKEFASLKTHETNDKLSKDLPLKMNEKVEDGQGTVIQLREMFKHNFSEGPMVDSMSKYGAKRGSYPTIADSSRNSFNASQIFRPSETESHIVNVSRLNEIEDQMDHNDKREEMRRYSMEMNIFGWNGENNGNFQEEILNSARGNPRQSARGGNSEGNYQGEKTSPIRQATPVRDSEKKRIIEQYEMRRSLIANPVIREEISEETERTSSILSKVNSVKSQGTPVFNGPNDYYSREFHSINSQFNSKNSLVGDKTAEELKRKAQERVSKDISSSAGKVNIPVKRECPQKIAYSTGKKISEEDLTALIGVRKFAEGLEKELSKKIQAKADEPLNSSLLKNEKKKTSEANSLNNSRISPQKESVKVSSVEVQGKTSNYNSANKDVPQNLKDNFSSRKKTAVVEELSDDERIKRDAINQLSDSASHIRIKTFLTLRSILRPHKAIALCCEGLLKLFAGFEEIPSKLVDQETVEWSQIKTFFNVPIKLVNLVSSFKTFVAEKKIPLKNIEIVLNILSQIQSHDEKSLHEAFYPLYNFLTAATSYYGIFAFEESPIAKIEEPMKNTQNLVDEKPETKTPVPMQYLELPRSKTDFIAHNSSKQSEPKVESVPAEPKQKQETINNTQNNRNDAVKVDVFGKETVKISDILKNKESIRPSATTEMRSVSVKSASKSPVKRLPEKSEQKEVKRAVSTQRARDVQVKKETQKKKDIKELKERIKNTQEEEDFRERMLFDARGVEPSEAEVLISEIETKEIESRDYRHKVKKMLADHDRYVKRFMKQQQDLEDEINREDAVQDWRKLREMLRQQNQAEKDYIHQKNMDYINEKKDAKDLQDYEEKENLNTKLLENYEDHQFKQYLQLKNKENKQQTLREKCRNVMADRLVRKQKETLESMASKEEFARKRRDHFKSKKIDITKERNKWQEEYMMLTKMIGNAK